jgi:hypothetical protein
MKNLITSIALCGLMTPASVMAQASEICPMLGELAQNTMIARQNGVSISDAYAAAAKIDIATEMVRQAYSINRWHSDGAKIRAVEDFSEYWEILCYDAHGEQT